MLDASSFAFVDKGRKERTFDGTYVSDIKSSVLNQGLVVDDNVWVMGEQDIQCD